jgi:hypothetical protein
MTMEELRRLSREVEWAAQEALSRSDGGTLDGGLPRFRELVALARNTLIQGREVDPTLTAGLRALAMTLLETCAET